MRRPLPPPRRHAEAGLTLVEVMISVLLFAILAAGALAALSSQQTTTATQQHASDTLSGARATFDALTKQLRLLKGGAPSGQVFINNDANLPPANTDDPFKLSGTANCGNGKVPVIQVENLTSGPDAIRILVPEGSTWGSLSVAAAGSDTHVQLVTGDGAAPLLVEDDWALISDFTNPAIVFKVGDSSAVTCPADFCLAKTAASPGWPSPPGTFNAGAFIVGARWLEYSISDTKFGDKLPALMVRDLSKPTDPNSYEPAAMGIEDLQVALWFDTNSDGTMDEDVPPSTTDEIVFNEAGDALPGGHCGLNNLRGVRITIVARATSQDRGARLGRPLAEDHAAGAKDGYYRVVMRSMIGLRNE